MMNLINSVQAPKTTLGKSVRDAVIVGLAGGAILLVQGIDGVDFGQYDLIVSSVAGLIIASLNRVTRK